MYVGILEVRVKVLDSINLKDKRRIFKSVFEKVKHKYNFSTAEVGEEDMINLGNMGFTCVSNSYSHIEDRLNKLESYLDNDFRFEILEIRRDIV